MLLGLSWYTLTDTDLALRAAPGGRPAKVGFGGWLGHALWLELSAELLANEKWEARNPWHAGTSQPHHHPCLIVMK